MLHGFRAAEEQKRLHGRFAGEFGKFMHVGEKGVVDGFRRFYLGDPQAARLFKKQVNFEVGVVAPEIKIAFSVVVKLVFAEFGHEQVFKNRPTLVVGGKVNRTGHFQQMASQTRVVKIEAGRFDEAFVEIAMVGGQGEHDITRFEHRKPRLGGGLGNADFVRQFLEVEHLPDVSGAVFQEKPKLTQVSHIDQLAGVPFKIGLDVVEVKIGRLDLSVEEGGIKTPESRIVPTVGQKVLGFEFGKRKRQQLEQSDPSGKALCDALQQLEVLRAGEDVLPHLAVIVHFALQIGRLN